VRVFNSCCVFTRRGHLLIAIALLPLHAADKHEIARADSLRREQQALSDRILARAAKPLSRAAVSSGPTITQQAKLIGATRELYDNDGRSVAISGSTAVVGGDGDAYIFVRNGTTWTLQATLIPSDGGYGAFGACCH
jgi:hypothetical protein